MATAWNTSSTQGALTVLVSGKKEGFVKAEPVLAQIGKHLFHLEAPGMATKMKLINQKQNIFYPKEQKVT